jgi:hypothetical protein
MPMCSSSPPITSLSLCSVMNCTAAGQRCSIFSRSCKNDAGGSTMRSRSRRGASSAWRSVNGGRWLARVVKLPVMWHERMRSSSITGVWLASESAKPSCTACTIDGRFGFGSSSHICDFIANAWLRSCMMLEPSP